MFVNISFS